MTIRINNIIITGNLVDDPVIRAGGASGDEFVTFRIGHSQYKRDANQESGFSQKASFFGCIGGKYIADKMRSCKKGGGVLVQGEISDNSWADSETGDTRTDKQINVRYVSLEENRENAVPQQKTVVATVPTATEVPAQPQPQQPQPVQQPTHQPFDGNTNNAAQPPTQPQEVPF